MTIPGLDWGMEDLMQKDQKKVPQKKVPYAKPIPAQFQQVTAPSNKQHQSLPLLPIARLALSVCLSVCYCLCLCLLPFL